MGTRQILGLNITAAQMFPHLALFGAEGEDEGQDPPPPVETDEVEETDEEEDNSPETFPKEYVSKLRRENAARRKELEAAQKELQAAREKDMTELQKAQTRAEEAEKRAEEAETRVLSVLRSQRIESVAGSLKFNDPADAHLLLNISELTTDDDGLPTTRAIKSALEKLVEAKPYLVNTPGSANGGADGKNPPVNKTEERTKALVEKGRVLIS